MGHKRKMEKKERGSPYTRAGQDAAGLLEGLLLVTVNSPK